MIQNKACRVGTPPDARTSGSCARRRAGLRAWSPVSNGGLEILSPTSCTGIPERIYGSRFLPCSDRGRPIPFLRSGGSSTSFQTTPRMLLDSTTQRRLRRAVRVSIDEVMRSTSLRPWTARRKLTSLSHSLINATTAEPVRVAVWSEVERQTVYQILIHFHL